MIALQPADLVLIAARTLNLNTEAVLDRLDLQAARAALAEVAPLVERSHDPARVAAALLHALVRHTLLPEAGKQVALMATAQFLALNGFQLDLDPPETTRTVIDNLTTGRLGSEELADWLAPRLRPCDDTSCGRPSRLGWLPIRRRRRRRSGPAAQDRFHRYTNRARTVVVLAQEEARRLCHNYIGTETLLLGLLREDQGVAAKTLRVLGITDEAVRHQVDQIVGCGKESPRGHIPFTPRAKKALLEHAKREALQLGHNYIGTEHLLLGLLRERDGVAAIVLDNFGATHDQIRDQMLALLAGASTEPAADLPWLRRYTEQIAQVQQNKQAAIDGGDLDTAAALRDIEERLLTQQQRIKQLASTENILAAIDENQHLRREVEYLRALLRQHGIQPDDRNPPTAQAGR